MASLSPMLVTIDEPACPECGSVEWEVDVETSTVPRSQTTVEINLRATRAVCVQCSLTVLLPGTAYDLDLFPLDSMRWSPPCE